jgi:hypothetical protein
MSLLLFFSWFCTFGSYNRNGMTMNDERMTNWNPWPFSRANHLSPSDGFDLYIFDSEWWFERFLKPSWRLFSRRILQLRYVCIWINYVIYSRSSSLQTVWLPTLSIVLSPWNEIVLQGRNGLTSGRIWKYLYGDLLRKPSTKTGSSYFPVPSSTRTSAGVCIQRSLHLSRQTSMGRRVIPTIGMTPLSDMGRLAKDWLERRALGYISKGIEGGVLTSIPPGISRITP